MGVATLVGVEIRRAKPSDASGLLELWSRLSADGHRADHRYEVADDAEATMRAVCSEWAAGVRPTWVAVIDDDLVGFIATKPGATHSVLRLPPTLVITDACVIELHRRRGVGRQLVETVRKFARTEGFRCVEVGTLANDERAVEFWRALGFGDWKITLSLDLERQAE